MCSFIRKGVLYMEQQKIDNAVKALRVVVSDLRESEYLGYNYSNIQAICEALGVEVEAVLK